VTDATTTWPFHCTEIADGTRSVEVGRRVAFDVVAGHLGRMEAVRVTKL
jgi:cold shock CspA family protein